MIALRCDVRPRHAVGVTTGRDGAAPIGAVAAVCSATEIRPGEWGSAVDEPRIVVVMPENIGQVERWRVDRQGTLNFLHAFLAGAWYQVVITRSDPGCIPPRALRMRPGEFAWQPRR
jgi:hypothetical protein